MRRLLYGFLRDAYRDVRVFSLDLVEFRLLTQDMALEGAWRPAIERLSAVMAEQTSVRDYLQGEKMVQGFVAAYLSISRYFVIHTEMELSKGYADLVLEPLRTRSPGMRYGYVIELKYLRRGASPAQVAATASAAEAQARRYLQDGRLAQRHPETAFKGLALVFCGWELLHAAEAAPEPPSRRRVASALYVEVSAEYVRSGAAAVADHRDLAAARGRGKRNFVRYCSGALRS